jgi:enterochelin esterase family protein
MTRSLILAIALSLVADTLLRAADAPKTAAKPNGDAATSAPKPTAKPAAIAPTEADVRYGEHERQVVDFYQAKSSTPTPVLFFIHGGGWVAGDKKGVNVAPYLAAGISVVSINYRYSWQAQLAGVKPPVKAPLEDAARALQFVRSKAKEWNLDKARIGASGGSAGACSSLWLAFHKEMADPNSADSIARESTRLRTAAVNGAQTSLDPKELKEWTPNSRYGGHAFGFMDPNDRKTRDTRFAEFLAHREELLPLINEYSPIAHVSADDPPVYLIYTSAPALGQEQKDPTHTANYGVKLQEKCKGLGVDCELVYPEAPNVKHKSIDEYLIAVLKAPATKPVATAQPARPQPPTRPFDAPSAPKFTRLDGKPGANPPLDAYGDFVVGPAYVAAPETKVVEGVPQGKVSQFSIDSKDCKLFNPGIARKVFGTVDPNNPKTLIVETHEIDYKRTVTVYVPAQYKPGTAAPFIVGHDGPGLGKPDMTLPRILDNLIAQKRVPAMIAILISSGGGDAQGHERGREYDTMSGLYAEFIENEVLPLVEKNAGVKLTKDPEGRAVMGNSSGGSAALIMAWYHPELYHRVLTFSGTFVNQQWPFDPKTPGGAWDFHEKLIPESEKKPLRIWMAVGDRDLLNPNVMRDDMHDWVEANNRMAKVLKAKGYPYQYLFCLDAGHGIGNARPQILPNALEWLWKGYSAKE